MISSELPEVLGMSDRIAVMHGGRIVGTLDRAAGDAGDPASWRSAMPGGRRGDLMIGRYRRELSVARGLPALLLLSSRSRRRGFSGRAVPPLRSSNAPVLVRRSE